MRQARAPVRLPRWFRKHRHRPRYKSGLRLCWAQYRGDQDAQSAGMASLPATRVGSAEDADHVPGLGLGPGAKPCSLRVTLGGRGLGSGAFCRKLPFSPPAPIQNRRTATRHRGRLNARRGCHCLVPEVRWKQGSSYLPGCKGCRALDAAASPLGYGTRLRRARRHTEPHGISNASGKV